MATPLILLVEDNEDLLFDEMLILEINGFEGISAKNGKEALDLLLQTEKIPDLIISDIMMPVMNGYDFYKVISENPHLPKIPFIFLSAKSSPEDIRFGQYLGVDAYITKPFTEKQLVEIIKEKLELGEKQQKIQEQFNNTESSLLDYPDIIERTQSLKKDTYLMTVFWDDFMGPKLKSTFPDMKTSHISFKDVAQQLYNVSVGLYGYHGFYGAEGILLKLVNIQKDGYLYFDGYKDSKMRGGEQIFMIAVIAPQIHYLASLKIKEIFTRLSNKIKRNEEFDLEETWNQIIEKLQLSN